MGYLVEMLLSRSKNTHLTAIIFFWTMVHPLASSFIYGASYMFPLGACRHGRIACLTCGRTGQRPEGTELSVGRRRSALSCEMLRILQLVSSSLSDATVRPCSQHFTSTSHTHVYIFHCSYPHLNPGLLISLP
jgi:hypothetical protein